jgi:hydrogenase maturation protease
MRIVVIGVGNPDRGDDGFGRVVATRLRGRLPARIDLVEADGEATALVERLGRADAAVLVDAAVSGARTGEIRRLDAAAAPLPAGRFGLSSHGFGVGEAIELARVLGSLPGRCVVYAVEAGSFAPGAALSREVAGAVDAVAARVIAEVAAWQASHA